LISCFVGVDNNIYNHLKPQGRFIFDNFVPDMKQLIDGLDNIIDFEGEHEPGKHIRRKISFKRDGMRHEIQYVTYP
jgi:hypothetical protein